MSQEERSILKDDSINHFKQECLYERSLFRIENCYTLCFHKN